MKYTVLGFSQKNLIDLDITVTEALLLRGFVDFKDARRKDGSPVMVSRIIDEKQYYWLEYDFVREEFPILGLGSPDSVYRKLKKLAEKGLLEHKTVRAGGTYSYYTLGPKYYQLLSNSDEKEENDKEENELISEFESKICKLREVTNRDFVKICEGYDKDFIVGIIDLCAGKGKSFNYFKKALKDKISKGIITKELLDKSQEDFKKEMEAKKIAALKEKQDPKVPTKEEREAIKESVDNKTKSEVVEGLEDLEEIKEVLKKDIPKIGFKTWIEQLVIKKENDIVKIFAANDFSKETVKKKYEANIIKALISCNVTYKEISYELIEI